MYVDITGSRRLEKIRTGTCLGYVQASFVWSFYFSPTQAVMQPILTAIRVFSEEVFR